MTIHACVGKFAAYFRLRASSAGSSSVSMARSSHRSRCRTTAVASPRHEWPAICNDYRMTNLANLDRIAHRNLRVEDERAFVACKDLTMCAVVLNEIPRLVIEYPLAFTKNGETGQYICVALFGVDPDREPVLAGRSAGPASPCRSMSAGSHFSSALRTNRRGADGAKGLVTCIDLENPGVQTTHGEALFDANGSESPYLRHKLAQLAELIDGEQKSRAFTEQARRARIFIQGFSSSSRRRISRRARSLACFRSTRRNCARSTAATSPSCMRAGYLHAMYAMLSSLGHLQILARRSAPLAGTREQLSKDLPKEKAPATFVTGAFFVRTLAVTYSRMAAATLSSARSVFTSEFEMGSGGSRSL